MWTQSSMVIAVRWMRVEWSQWGTWMEWATTATRSQMVGQCATVTVGTKRVWDAVYDGVTDGVRENVWVADGVTVQDADSVEGRVVDGVRVGVRDGVCDGVRVFRWCRRVGNGRRWGLPVCVCG